MSKYFMVAFAALGLLGNTHVEPDSNPGTHCIALAIQKEAGNQSMEGKKAVGHVIVNRSKSGSYPSDVCKVVFQKHGTHCQFSWVCSKKSYAVNISKEALQAARLSLIEADNTKGSISFHVLRVHPKWNTLKRTVTIGQHVFYASRSRQTRTDFS